MKKDFLAENFKMFENAVVNPSHVYGGQCPLTAGPTSKEDTKSGEAQTADDCHVDDYTEDCPAAAR